MKIGIGFSYISLHFEAQTQSIKSHHKGSKCSFKGSFRFYSYFNRMWLYVVMSFDVIHDK